MEAPTDIQKLIEQVQLLLAQSAAQNERIAALEAENAALKKALAASNARVAELERRLGLNSSNSGSCGRDVRSPRLSARAHRKLAGIGIRCPSPASSEKTSSPLRRLGLMWSR